MPLASLEALYWNSQLSTDICGYIWNLYYDLLPVCQNVLCGQTLELEAPKQITGWPKEHEFCGAHFSFICESSSDEASASTPMCVNWTVKRKRSHQQCCPCLWSTVHCPPRETDWLPNDQMLFSSTVSDPRLTLNPQLLIHDSYNFVAVYAYISPYVTLEKW